LSGVIGGRIVGCSTDMTEHGWKTDKWPSVHAQVMASDILVLAGPIWLGDNPSVMKQVIERCTAARPTSTSLTSTPITAGSVAA
jgi:multimeric flavodoxin WrbA